jgi:glutamine synthetase
MASTIQQFLREHGISEVEAIIPDMAGVARGKLMPAEKFAEEEGMRLPEAIFLQTVTGDYPEDQSAMNPSDIDIRAHCSGHSRLFLRRWQPSYHGAALCAAPDTRSV